MNCKHCKGSGIDPQAVSSSCPACEGKGTVAPPGVWPELVSTGAFTRATDRARRSWVLAAEIAIEMGHNFIGTEHMLLGLIREGEGVAFKAIEALVPPEKLEYSVKSILEGFSKGEKFGDLQSPALVTKQLREELGACRRYIAALKAELKMEEEVSHRRWAQIKRVEDLGDWYVEHGLSTAAEKLRTALCLKKETSDED